MLFQTKISLLHDAVNSGRLEELQALLDEEPIERRKRLVTAKDDFGVGLLHKAVYYDLKNIYKYLIDKFPHIVPIKDSVRIFLHVRKKLFLFIYYLLLLSNGML